MHCQSYHHCQIIQKMVFETGPHCGKAKGLRAVCAERFGEAAVAGERQDALVARLEAQTDFW